MGQSVLLLLTFTLCLVVVQSLYIADLSTILQSTGETLELYSAYKEEQNLEFDSFEDSQRFRLFKVDANRVANLNLDTEESALFEMNFFSVMTDNEKKDWTGLNITGNPFTDLLVNLRTETKAPKQKSWIEEGAVTEIKSQGSCGSCWAFSAAATFETRYKLKSDKLESFSAQEFLDCTYQDSTEKKNGCHEGAYWDAWSYSRKNGGRIAAASDYPYTGHDGECRSDSIDNAAVAAKIKRLISVDSQTSVIQALADGAVSLGVNAQNAKFLNYKSGVLKGYPCYKDPDHAVTAVGYTEEFVLIKNSWGKGWGEEGFIKMARKEEECVLWKYGSYPEIESTSKMDSWENDVVPTYDDGEKYDVECKDKHESCLPRFCDFEEFSGDWCRKTCGHCASATCEDRYMDCEDGFCDYFLFANHYCQKSCGLCTVDFDLDF